MNKNRHKPPIFAEWLLSKLTDRNIRYSAMGDFAEQYYYIAEYEGIWRARSWYFAQLLQSIPSFIYDSIYWSIAMLKNFMLVSMRNISRNKVHSFINILGLSTGLAVCLLILMYVNFELSYDRHHDRSEDIYRLTTKIISEASETALATSPPPVAKALKADFPEVQFVSRLMNPPGVERNIISYEEKRFYEQNGFLADSSFFDIFSYRFTSGNPQKALVEPNTVVLSAGLAHKIFGLETPMNKIIQIGNVHGKYDYKVTGVFLTPEHNTHIDAHFFTSMNSKGIGEYAWNLDIWSGNNFIHTYLKLQPGADAAALEAKLPAFLNKYAAEQLKEAAFQKTHSLQPVSDIHLHSAYIAEHSANGNILHVYIFSTIAVFILLIACINFMNLSTARAGKRAKEVGLRKVMGADKRKLIMQFLGESFAVSLLAVILALLIARLALPAFNQLADTSMTIDAENIVFYLLSGVGIALITAVLGGFYPAFYLSSFQPAEILRGKLGNQQSAIFLRKGLIVFQFGLSIILICGSLIISRQLVFIQNKDLGFDKAQRLIIPFRMNTDGQPQRQFKQAALNLPEIISAGSTTSYPGIFLIYDNYFHLQGKSPDEKVHFSMNFVDYDVVETIGHEIVAGRSFSKDFPGDNRIGLVINETAMTAFGLTLDNVIGQKVVQMGRGEDADIHEIVGVVKDFNWQSLEKAVEPYVYILTKDRAFPYIILNAQISDMPSLLASLKSIWSDVMPEAPFEYQFLDQEVEKQYAAYERTASIVQFFTLLAIIIACLGLYGISAHNVELRVREIGVRKVLGASLFNITSILSREFLLLVFLANLIAWPAAYFIMDSWLQDFSYRIDIQPPVFLVTGILSVFIALFTVSFQAIKAGLANPVDALRHE